ncbi:response regulator transcription factor [Planctobacterium marinum]|uniref:response regulator transcription factor n=1 Tax=Planctobacterium marinum TaxID=1631968 RepID=UPI001E2F061A|nr:response regulator [Planctobacterium marinum]MCC2607073.1 response regulator [Planctobacterium marinum]
MSQPRICIVEPDDIEQELLQGMLEDDYQVCVFSSGEEMLTTLTPDQPTLIILETLLPGPTGYEICRIVEKDFSHCFTYTIFLSAKTSVEERIRGMEAGADDYINKPYDVVEVARKVHAAMEMLCSTSGLKKQLDYASHTAFQAMSAQSEMGIIMRGVQDANKATHFGELSQAMFSCLAELSLKSTLYYEVQSKPRFEASAGRNSTSMEQEIITVVRRSERIWTRGSRCIFTFGDTSLLVLNMPDDEEKTGRLRDNLCFLMETFEVKVDALNQQQALTLARDWQHSVKEVTQLLNIASQDLQHSIDGSTKTIRNMMSDLEMLLPSLGLEEDQEERIHHIIDTAFDDYNHSLQKTEQTGLIFNKVMSKLKNMQ